MAIDIRNARKPEGTVPPKNIASEKASRKIPDVGEDGQITMQSDYDGDPVIAGYMEYLNKNDITEEDIQNVLQAIITSSGVSWKFKLFDSIPVTFNIRESWVDDYIVEVVDALSSNNQHLSTVHYNNIVAQCNLAASMVEYNGEKYVIANEDDLSKARERIRKMPYVIQNALVKKLAVFDRTIAVATSDWAVKNFTKPRQEKSEPGQS